MNQYFIHFLWLNIHCMNTTHFTHTFVFCWHLDYLYLLGIITTPIVNIFTSSVQIIFQVAISFYSPTNSEWASDFSTSWLTLVLWLFYSTILVGMKWHLIMQTNFLIICGALAYRERSSFCLFRLGVFKYFIFSLPCFPSFCFFLCYAVTISCPSLHVRFERCCGWEIPMEPGCWRL